MPGDSSFVLMKKDSLWFAGDHKADSAKTAGYLSSLSVVDGQEFRDGYKPDSSPLCQMLIEGNNLLNISVKCYLDNEDKYIMNSSLNPEVYYESTGDGIYQELFKPLAHFR
jgi:hypothetical protein